MQIKKENIRHDIIRHISLILDMIVKPQEKREKKRGGGKETNKQWQQKDLEKQTQDNLKKKMTIRRKMSIITLNVNALNAPTKSHKLAEWIQNQELYIRWP